MDGVDKLATSQPGDVDLVEVRSVGQSSCPLVKCLEDGRCVFHERRSATC